MDKKGLIQEHSKIKLELYRLYLERYLSVLLVTPFFDSIEVIDVFAGSGISENAEKGSAVIAAETITALKSANNKFGKKIALKLNDADQESCDALTENVKAYDFASVSCGNADTYIQNWNPTAGSHNLLFIDPHGYTQVSTANLKRLFSLNNCDFLIFIPIYHIYRFLKPSLASNQEDDSEEDLGLFDSLGIETEASQKPAVDKEKYYEPIAKFLTGLGIGQTEIENCHSVEEFSDLIIQSLRKLSGSDYVYSHTIKKSNKNSKYGLFFISHHILGAEKFLEAKGQLKEKIKKFPQQTAFDFVNDEPQEQSILSFVDCSRQYDNVSLYQEGIKFGFRPTALKKELKELEASNKVEINPLPGKTRNRKGLYIDYANYKDNKKIISLKFKK